MNSAIQQIESLKSRLSAVATLSEDYMDALDDLLSAVSDDAQKAIDSFDMPVYKSGAERWLVLTITKSTKKPGYYQVTRFNQSGALGDTEYSSMRSLVSSEGLIHKNRLCKSDAEIVMTQIVEAEAAYQDRKVELAA